jgi:hypothetical protein
MSRMGSAYAMRSALNQASALQTQQQQWVRE